MGTEVWSGLVGLAGGGASAAILNWLLNRHRQAVETHGREQLDVTEVAGRYWQRVTALEARVSELHRANNELLLAVTQRDVTIAELQARVSQLEARLAGASTILSGNTEGD